MTTTEGPDEQLVDTVARVVRATPGVHALHGGVLGEVATYLPGRRVTGIRMHDGGCDVHLVLAYGATVSATADAVRASLRSLLAGSVGVVDVYVEDVLDRRPDEA